MHLPKIIQGSSYTDSRGTLFFNNIFDASAIKRMYIIQNSSIEAFRGWQGHKVEQRWFSVINGSFEIYLIAVDNWEKPSKNLKLIKYHLNAANMDVLHVPSGFVSSIRSKEHDSKLLAMSNYGLGEINDEYKYEINFFKLVEK
tara:strand:- start:233 stop:661 length:429 start_codon:yes stop_codon:yes gene_type:complete